MRKSVFTIISIAAILISNPAISNGFKGSDLAKAAQEAASVRNTETVEAINATEVFRLQMTYNPKGTYENLPEPFKQNLLNILGEFNNKRQYQTAWFMAGAIVKTGDKPFQTKLYNPLAQIWLDINWVKENDKLSISEIIATNSVVDDWSAKSGPYLLALANSYIGSLQANTRNPAQNDTLFATTDKWIKGLADWALNPAKAGIVEATQNMILNGECAKFGADGAVIDTLPREVRASFSPVTGFNNDNGGAVLFGTPLYPHIIIAADFDKSNQPKLKNFTLLNLQNVGAK